MQNIKRIILSSAAACLSVGLVSTSPVMAQSGGYSADIGSSIDQWKMLDQSDSMPFASYANFLAAHPGFPNETAMRQRAERAINFDYDDPQSIVAHFKRYPPLTAKGQAAYALALQKTGDSRGGAEAARKAWAAGSLIPDDEARLINAFPGVFDVASHDARMDRLLWDGATQSAQRQISFVSPEKRPLFNARLSMQLGWPDAATLAAQVPARDQADAGFIRDRADWLRRNGQDYEAQRFLADRPQLLAPPLNAEAWFLTLLASARSAESAGQYDTAFKIASRLDDAYPPGTDVSTRSYGERDQYTNLAWLAGRIGLEKLNRPREAAASFDRYGRAAKSAQTKSKGFYWAGRAAQRGGDSSGAQQYYSAAMRYPTTFYGQLSFETNGQKAVIPPMAKPPISDADRNAFQGSPVVQAIRYLGFNGRWTDQSLFIRALANGATTEPQISLGHKLSDEIGRDDLSVMLSRTAADLGFSNEVRDGFPTIQPAPGAESLFPVINGITRQESQFDRKAVSSAGAKGMMQLMPGTARETAGKLGVGYNPTSLTEDPSYNIMLGSSYFQRMLSNYGGSYPLAIAAYNAGPGNVNKWLRANGDPRTGGVDWISWIEAIPFTETRGYVQRVLENAVSYELLYPDKAIMGGDKPLHRYLGMPTR